MTYLVFILLFFSFNIFAEPCNVELFSKILKTDKDINFLAKDIIKTSTCSDTINNQIVQIISNSKTNELFVNQIEKAVNQDLHITPRKITLSDLNSILHDQLSANSNYFYFDIKSLNNLKIIALSEDETLRAICDSCTTLGEKNIKLEITNPTIGSMKALWVTSKIFAKTKVIKAKRTIGFQQKALSADDFYIDETYTMLPDQLLGNLDNINFFKPNKTIIQGSIITNLDIQPVNLVNYGVPVKAILKNQLISLTKMAQPVRSAQFGEIVELKVGNNKTISGKVIDYNQVVIEL